MTALRTVNSVPDSSWHSYLICHWNMSFLQICLVYATKKKKKCCRSVWTPGQITGKIFSLLLHMRVNHYQHTGDHPSVRCVMLKYAGASVLQLSVTGGTLKMKSKRPRFGAEQRSAGSAQRLGQYCDHCSSQWGLTFCHRMTGCSVPFSLTVWTLTCQKKKGGKK